MCQDHAEPRDSSAADAARARLVDDYLARRAAGEVIGPATFSAEHPDAGPELGDALAMLDHLRPPPDPLELLRGRGVLRDAPDSSYRAFLDDYGIVGVLGLGGMGIVLEGFDPSVQRPVAIKLLHPLYVHEQAAVARFRREALAAARLQHPNIVTIHAVGQSAGVPYIVMEYVPGSDLRQFLRAHGPLEAGPARRVFAELLAGLAAAHAQHIMHRDIKPANILLTRAALARLSPQADASASGREPDGPWAKIADFGLARCTGDLTAMTVPGALLGTPECMSPEQLRGGQDVDERTDLYSAGVVAYHMLTGRPPFEATTVAGMLQRVVSEEPPAAAAVSAGADPVLSSIARRLMAPMPADRFPSAGAALAALRAERPVRYTGRGGSRRRRLVLLAVLVAVAAAAPFLLRPAAGSERIRALDVDDDTRTLRVWYGRSTTPTVPPELPATFERLRAATLLDVDGRGTQRIAVGSLDPSRREHVFLLDTQGRPTRGLFLGLVGDWPGFRPDDPWVCQGLAAGPLDAEPGNELIAATSHASSQPSRVAVIDPRTGEVRASFWHHGHINRVVYLHDFFGDGQPAIFACGCTEEPNEFPCAVTEQELRTRYDFVYAYMILDPRTMVPAEAPPPIGAAVPPPGLHAYAFLDVPIDLTAHSLASAPAATAEADPRLHLSTYTVLPSIGPGPAGQLIQIGLEDRDHEGVALLKVDGNFRLVEVQLASGAKTVVSETFLRDRWRRRVPPPTGSE
ncbi:MAG: serine/threonine-protein kinase [Phycisphaerae bacterium]|jgi:hypothetical protein